MTPPDTPCLKLCLFLPPSVNDSHLFVPARSKTGKLYTRKIPSPTTKAWRRGAFVDIRNAIVRHRWRPIAEGKVIVELTYFWPDSSRDRDTHNRIKELMDALEHGGVFRNDCQALAREQDFTVDPERPRIEAVVYRKAEA